jgi:hypothetical protein
MIEKWRLGMRVRIVDHGGDVKWNGRTGSVIRICISNDCAWIRCDQALPAEMRSFSADDPRHNDARVYKDECEEIHGTRVSKALRQ